MFKIVVSYKQKPLQYLSRLWRKTSFILLVCLGLLTSIYISAIPIHALETPLHSSNNLQSLLQQGLTLHREGNFTSAIALWQQAAQDFVQQEDTLNEAITWRYLSLSYQELGKWQEANNAITKSLNLLQNNATPSPLYWEILGKAFNTQGRLQWQQGQLQDALVTWQQATLNYQKADYTEGVITSLINQAQVLQALGFSSQAQATLAQVTQNLQQQPDSELKAASMRHLGKALRRVGKLNDSDEILQASLAIAQQPHNQSAILLELGNTNSKLAEQSLAIGEQREAQNYTNTAINYYQQASVAATKPLLKLQAQLNQFSLFTDTENYAQAERLKASILSIIDNLPPSHAAIYAQLNFAQSLIQSSVTSHQSPAVRTRAAVRLSRAFPRRTSSPGSRLKGMLTKRVTNHQSPINNQPSTINHHQDIAAIITRAGEQARQIGDVQAQSYAWGQLGRLYELNQQWKNAQKLTEKALQQLEGIDAPDIRYRWEWQLGRLLRQQSEPEAAIKAYNRAIATLESVRDDLLLIDPEIQFSFRDNVEPIYRQLVDLLLQTEDTAQLSQSRLNQAVQEIDALQLAELENFLHCDLSPTVAVVNQNLKQIEADAAFIYPILLDERLEVIYKLPGQPLEHHAQVISRQEAEETLRALRRAILRGNAGRVIQLSAQVYQWLIAPLETDLQSSAIKTLVFVLDGDLRNIPMTVLFDGKTNEYLIEKPYGITLLPSLQLFDLRPESTKFQVLGAGISQALQVGDRSFTALNVTEELGQVQQTAASEILLDKEFTRSNLQEKLNSENFSVVHLATHGNFSSNPEETYILVYSPEKDAGELLKADDLDLLLRTQANAQAIDLLILSACKTAEGDNRATLGLAGLAVQAGARSTLASLWQVSDDSTVELMEQFYQALKQPGMTKAQALRQAQLTLLQNPQYQTPYYWAPYVLVGNWQ